MTLWTKSFIKPWSLNHGLMALIKRMKRYPMVLIGAINTETCGSGLFPRRRRWRWVSTVAPWPSAVAHQSGGWRALWSMASSGSKLKSKHWMRGSHQGVLRAATIIGRWRTTARLQLLSSAMAGGGSKGWNGPSLHQMGVAQRRQAHRAITVAQNTVEWQP
jgi:hypothetical protein